MRFRELMSLFPEEGAKDPVATTGDSYWNRDNKRRFSRGEGMDGEPAPGSAKKKKRREGDSRTVSDASEDESAAKVKKEGDDASADGKGKAPQRSEKEKKEKKEEAKAVKLEEKEKHLDNKSGSAPVAQSPIPPKNAAHPQVVKKESPAKTDPMPMEAEAPTKPDLQVVTGDVNMDTPGTPRAHGGGDEEEDKEVELIPATSTEFWSDLNPLLHKRSRSFSRPGANFPMVGGKPLDLLKFFTSVMTRGGGEQVANENLWELVAKEDLGLNEATTDDKRPISDAWNFFMLGSLEKLRRAARFKHTSRRKSGAPETPSRTDMWFVRCICGDNHGRRSDCTMCAENDESVCCDACQAWQHITCLGLHEDFLPSRFFCEVCRVYQPDAPSVAACREAYLKAKAEGKVMDKKERLRLEKERREKARAERERKEREKAERDKARIAADKKLREAEAEKEKEKERLAKKKEKERAERRERERLEKERDDERREEEKKRRAEEKKKKLLERTPFPVQFMDKTPLNGPPCVVALGHACSTHRSETAVEEIVQSQRSAGDFRRCGMILQAITRHKWVFPFMKPVDPYAFDPPLEDYFTVVKTRMDLGTVKTNLENDRYNHPDDFAADVRLTFCNAMAYNPAGTDVHSMARSLGHLFEDKYASLNLPAFKDKIKDNDDERIWQIADEKYPRKLPKEEPTTPKRSVAKEVKVTQEMTEEEEKEAELAAKKEAERERRRKRDAERRALDRERREKEKADASAAEAAAKAKPPEETDAEREERERRERKRERKRQRERERRERDREQREREKAEGTKSKAEDHGNVRSSAEPLRSPSADNVPPKKKVTAIDAAAASAAQASAIRSPPNAGSEPASQGMMTMPMHSMAMPQGQFMPMGMPPQMAGMMYGMPPQMGGQMPTPQMGGQLPGQMPGQMPAGFNMMPNQGMQQMRGMLPFPSPFFQGAPHQMFPMSPPHGQASQGLQSPARSAAPTQPAQPSQAKPAPAPKAAAPSPKKAGGLNRQESMDNKQNVLDALAMLSNAGAAVADEMKKVQSPQKSDSRPRQDEAPAASPTQSQEGGSTKKMSLGFLMN